MLFSTLVLISVNCEHDGLEQRVDFGHGDESAEVGDVSRLRLEKEEQVAVLLCLFIVGEKSFLEFEAVGEVVCDFVLLYAQSVWMPYMEAQRPWKRRTSSNAMRF